MGLWPKYLTKINRDILIINSHNMEVIPISRRESHFQNEDGDANGILTFLGLSNQTYAKYMKSTWTSSTPKWFLLNHIYLVR